jgi:cell division protein FtsB
MMRITGRLNSYTLALLAVILVGIFTLAPSVQIWYEQRQEIADYKALVEQAKVELEDMEAERLRWDDEVYIRAQARDRLYFVMPGEVSFLVMDADGIDVSDTSGTVGAMLAQKRKLSGFSAEVLASKDNWIDALLESGLRSGLEQPNQEIDSVTN